MKVPILIEQSLIHELIEACADVEREAAKQESRGALQTPIKTSHQDAINRRLHAWHTLAKEVSKNITFTKDPGKWRQRTIVEHIGTNSSIVWNFWEHDRCGSLSYIAGANDVPPSFCPRCCHGS
jgi:hypothetical protein